MQKDQADTAGDNFFVSDSTTLLDKEFAGEWLQYGTTISKEDYFLFLERIQPKDISPLYILIKKQVNNELIICASLYIQLVRFGKENINLKNPILNFLTKGVLSLRRFRLFICGNVFAVNFPAISYNESFITSAQLAGIIQEQSKKIRSDAIVIKDLPSEFNEKAMSEFGFSTYSTDLTMTLNLNATWNSFADYKNSLSKKYRKRLEKIKGKGKILTKNELTYDQVQKNSIMMKELFDQVAEKQIVRIGMIKDNYFSEFMHTFPGKFKVTGYFSEDKLVGFYSSMDRKETLEIHYIGMDYTVNATHSLYFNILFDSVEEAIKYKKKRLELGRTAREAKASLGCQPEYFNDYIRIDNPIAAFLSKAFTVRFQAEIGENWKDRNPFKNAE